MTVKDGLVWYWDLDSADASVVDQHSGLSLSRVGTTTMVTGGAPDGGNCVSVGNAAGKYRNSSVTKTINYDVGFSVNIWGFSTADSFFGNWLINHRNDPSAPPDNRYFQVVARSNTGTDGFVVWGPSATLRVVSSSPAVAQNQWAMFTLVDNGVTTQSYVNGVLIATSNTTLAARNTGPAAFAIGGDSWNGGINANTSHRGRLSMAGVWDRPLTADEITWLYNSGAGRRYNSLQFGERDVGGEVLWICPSLDDIGNGTLIARDLTTNRSHGTLTNMEVGDWVADTGSGGVRALDFDGTNDYVSVGNQPTLNFGTGNFSLSFWMKTNSNLRRSICNKFVYSGTPVDEQGFYVDIQANGTLRTSIETPGPSVSFRVRDSSIAVNDGVWHHVAVVRTGVSNFLDIYIDGVLRNGGTLSNGTVGSISCNAEFEIGREWDELSQGNTGFFIGQIDDFRIFSRNLFATEITALSSQRGYQPPAYTGIGGEMLWVCPTLDSLGNGTLLARDLTYQRNHGTMTGMVVGDWLSDTDFNGVRAINFDAITKIIDFANASLHEPKSTGSLTAWVRFSVLDFFAQIFTKRLNSFVNNPIGLDINGTSLPRTILANGSSFNVVTGSSILANTWYHFASTWDGSTLRLYVNGLQVGSTTQTISPQTGTGAMSIGNVRRADNTLPGPYGTGPMRGRVDDLRYFHRSLAANEIAALASQRGYQPITSVRRRRNIGNHGL